MFDPIPLVGYHVKLNDGTIVKLVAYDADTGRVTLRGGRVLSPEEWRRLTTIPEVLRDLWPPVS